MKRASSSRLEVKGNRNLDIAEVSRRARLPASTLRYYEEKGLILSIGRLGLRRLFDHRVLEKLAIISLGRAAGFSLQEMAGMFGPDGQPRIDRRVLANKADELGATIRKLTAVRKGLIHAASCRAPSHLECPTFQRILRATASGKIREQIPPAPRPRTRQAA
jgi:DNA-binding transcriptional MerR regulator